MLKAIAFDLWETLITNPPEPSRGQERLRLALITEILREHGAERLEAAYRQTWRRCQELYWSEDRDVPCRRQIEHMLELLELDPRSFDEETLLALEEAYARPAIEILPFLVDGAKEVMSDLKSRGYRLGLISNTGRTPGSALRQVLGRLDLAPFLDAMVFSNEIGVCKPQRPIFESLRESLGVAYDEMLFVGDNLYVDVHGAQSCGMRGVHFIPAARGSAVAPSVDHGLEIVADAVIRDLRELPGVVTNLYGDE